MLSHINLHKFHPHTHLSLNLKPLTILTGANATGKSSILRAISAASILSEKDPPNSLHKLISKRYFNNEDTRVEIIKNREKYIFESYSNNKKDYHQETNTYKSITVNTINSDNRWELLNWFFKQMEMFYLNTHIVFPKLRHPDCKEDYHFIDQANYWSSKIFNFRSLIEIRDFISDCEHFSINKGMLSVLPIILQVLYSNDESILLIENPELNLSPYSQSNLMEFLAVAAQSGVQIILETHSDHIVNGARIQGKNFYSKNRGISRENIVINHLRQNKEGTREVEEISISSNGKLSKYPNDFLLNQWTDDMAKLF